MSSPIFPSWCTDDKVILLSGQDGRSPFVTTGILLTPIGVGVRFIGENCREVWEFDDLESDFYRCCTLLSRIDEIKDGSELINGHKTVLDSWLSSYGDKKYGFLPIRQVKYLWKIKDWLTKDYTSVNPSLVPYPVS